MPEMTAFVDMLEDRPLPGWKLVACFHSDMGNAPDVHVHNGDRLTPLPLPGIDPERQALGLDASHMDHRIAFATAGFTEAEIFAITQLTAEGCATADAAELAAVRDHVREHPFVPQDDAIVPF